MDIRSKVVIGLMVFLAISYSSALFIAANVLFLDMNKMNTWRDFTFSSYIVAISYMALTHLSDLEKELIKVAICYFAIIFIVKILGYNFNMPNIQYSIIFVNLVTMAFVLIVLRNAKKHHING